MSRVVYEGGGGGDGIKIGAISDGMKLWGMSGQEKVKPPQKTDGKGHHILLTLREKLKQIGADISQGYT